MRLGPRLVWHTTLELTLRGDAGLTQALQKTVIYAVLLAWTFVCLFPIFWTVTTAFKEANDIYDGDLVPWVQFEPNWKGWESLGL